MIALTKKPKALDGYSVSSFDLESSIGEVGALGIYLHSREAAKQADLKLIKSLQDALGGVAECALDTWSFAGRIHEMAYETANNMVRIVIKDDLSKLAERYRSQVFSEQKLGDIVSKVTSGLKCDISSGFDKSEVKLAIQYQESDLAFLKRLVNRFGGQIWCADGTIYVGLVRTSKTVTVKLDRDVLDYTVYTGLGIEEVTMVQIPYKNVASQSAKVKLPGGGHGSLQDSVKDQRKKNQGSSSFHAIVEDTSYADAEFLGQRFLKALASGRLSIAGTLKSPVPLGSCVKIADADGNEETLFIRSLRANSGRDPRSYFYFEAANPDALVTHAATPEMGLHASTATVVDAKDPNKMNRVRVAFPWDQNGRQTPWLRVASPYWGDKHVHYLPPEKEDGVLVVWGQDDLEPIVLGCLSIGHAVGQSGETFVLKTPEGHTVSIGAKDIKIVNEVDGGTSSVEIKPDKIVISSGTIELKSTNSMKLDSDKLELTSKQVQLDSTQMQLKSKQGTIESPLLELKAVKLDVKS